jgi:hypothetical protein
LVRGQYFGRPNLINICRIFRNNYCTHMTWCLISIP